MSQSSQELESESVVAIFWLLRAWQQIDSHMDALSDIIVSLATVFDAEKLNWYRQAIRIGLQLESETQMPNCLDALVEQGMKKGLDSSSSPPTHFQHVAFSGRPIEVVILPRISPATECGLCLFTVHSPLH
jgi:hypothetical protein